MRKKWAILLAGGMMLLGLSVLLYPTVSSLINRRNGSYAIQELQQQIDAMDSVQMESAFREARAYNEMLLRQTDMDDAANLQDYEQILDLSNGIMGYITIDKIDVRLPIYHGVSTQVLEKGVGHLPTSAFPIGGEGNHTVLTGHTGLPSAKLFTDLTELTEGDRFEVTIGNLQTVYQVDRICIVLPSETEDLMPVPGADYCTLVTCTPYGVNSHRLLVRGKRVELAEEVTHEIPPPQEKQPETGMQWIWLLPAPIVLLAIFRKRKRGSGDV